MHSVNSALNNKSSQLLKKKLWLAYFEQTEELETPSYRYNPIDYK